MSLSPALIDASAARASMMADASKTRLRLPALRWIDFCRCLTYTKMTSRGWPEHRGQHTPGMSAPGDRASRSQKVAFDTRHWPSISTASPSRPSKTTWSFSRIE